MNAKHRLISTTLALAACLGAGASLAQQAYPARPIRMVIPLPPGGAIDIVARTTGAIAAERLGQTFVYDNRPGANTIVATENCTRAAPDGYTICFITSSLTLNQFLYSKLPYDSARDIEPITNLVMPYEGLFLSASVPAGTLNELVEYSKANPGKLNFGSLGVGGAPHLVPEWVVRHTGASFTHVPYKGIAEVMRAFAAGEIHMMFVALGNPGFIDNVRSGKMKLIFVSADRRSPSVPEAPTLSEAGVPDHGFRSWWGMAAPAGTPRDLIGKLHAAFVEALRSPGVRQRFLSLGLEVVGNTPEEFGRYIAEDRPRGERLVRTSGARLD